MLRRINLLKVGLVVIAIFLFILALQVLKEGADGLAPLLQRFDLAGVINSLGFGWLGAHLVLSGSPVAATALTLFAARVTTDVETFAMITGSRLGAAFVVLLVGFIYYLRGRGGVTSVFVGVLCFLVTATVYLPALVMGYLVLVNGWLEGFHLNLPSQVEGLMALTYDPLVESVTGYLPNWGSFLLGVGLLLVSFNIFDRALPELDVEHSRFREIAHIIYRPAVMFLFGSAVTMIVPSVSVSLGLLVPFSARGYVRRENIIPYIMGANVATFSDTLLASLLVNAPRAFAIVFLQAASVGVVSLVVIFFYGPYQHVMEHALAWFTNDQRRLGFFVAVIMIAPLVLMLM